MTEEQITQTVHEVLAEIAPEASSITLRRDVNFRDQIEFDSMDFVSFVLAMDKRLGLRTPEADYPRLSSLTGCIEYLSDKTGA